MEMPTSSNVTANGAIRVSQLTQVNSLASNSTVVVTVFSGTSNGQTRAANLDVLANSLPITKVEAGTFTNSTANTTVVEGRLFFDADNLYVSVANGSIKRATLSEF